MKAWICRDCDRLCDGFIDVKHQPVWKEETRSWMPGDEGLCDTVADIESERLESAGIWPGQCYQVEIKIVPRSLIDRTIPAER